jgi:hypothetical protein
VVHGNRDKGLQRRLASKCKESQRQSYRAAGLQYAVVPILIAISGSEVMNAVMELGLGFLPILVFLDLLFLTLSFISHFRLS